MGADPEPASPSIGILLTCPRVTNAIHLPSGEMLGKPNHEVPLVRGFVCSRLPVSLPLSGLWN
jgi:hypothetical protein